MGSAERLHDQDALRRFGIALTGEVASVGEAEPAREIELGEWEKRR
jgi:hypothetical protein